jgi:hypothetical protein
VVVVATVTMLVCDICKSAERPATNYSVEGGGRRATVDLCDEDGASLREVLDKFSVTRRRGAGTARTSPRFEEYVGTMEDVETAKAALKIKKS